MGVFLDTAALKTWWITRRGLPILRRVGRDLACLYTHLKELLIFNIKRLYFKVGVMTRCLLRNQLRVDTGIVLGS